MYGMIPITEDTSLTRKASREQSSKVKDFVGLDGWVY